MIIFLYAKYPYESKYQHLIKMREEVGLKHFKDPKSLMEDSNGMNGVYNSTEEYKPRKDQKVLIVFDDMITAMISDKSFTQ